MWQLQEAKAKLSEVIRLSQMDGPQHITMRGEEIAVLLSKKDYETLMNKKQSFVEFMNSSPLKGMVLQIKRKVLPSRDINL